jgi:putative spermidine/putrescine transport system substrate-binding protein
MPDDVLNALQSTLISRRRLLAATGLGIGAGVLAACGHSPGSAPSSAGGEKADPKKPVSLTFFHYATSNQEVVPKAVTDQYMKENPNVKITLMSGSNATTYPALVAAYKTTGVPTINAGYFNASSAVQGDLDGLWRTLSATNIPHLNDVLDTYRRPGDKGVGWGLGLVGLGYRKDLVTPAPTSWLDILDPRFKGEVGLVDAPLFQFNGLYAVNHIKGGDESNMDPGFTAFKAAAKAGQFSQIYQATQLVDLLLSSAFELTGFSYGNLGPAIQKGAPLGFSIPVEGGIAFPLYFQIVNGSTPEQIYHSEQILNRLLAPDALARYAELTLTVPTTKNAKLPASLANDPVFAIGTVKNALQIDWKAAAANQGEYLDRWNRDVKANL